MTQKRIDDIKSGREVLYIWGTVKYEDVFKRSHYTKFCFLGKPMVNPDGKFELRFTVCNKHNDND